MLIDLLLLFILLFSLLFLITIIVNMIWGAPYVPSNRKTIDRMLREANLNKGQIVYDLGCGDGRLLIRAEKQYGVHGIGYEGAPIPYLFALILKCLHRSSVDIRFSNFFKASLGDAEVIFLYLGPEIQQKLAQKIQEECLPGTLIVANTFSIPSFKHFKKIPADKKAGTKLIHMYKLPSK